MKVDEALVNAHLKVVPGLGTLTTGRLSGGVRKNLGGETNRTLDAELLVLGAVHKVRADWSQQRSVPRGERERCLC